MGCGESKHDVATGNTITRKKSNVGDQSKKSKDIETVQETGTKDTETDLLVQQQQEGDQNANHGVGGDDHTAADVRDIDENTETLKGDDRKEKQDGLVEEQEPAGRLISKDSPNRYFSSRKEEEAVDRIVSEGKSDYYSPRHEGGKESLFKDNEKVNNAVEATNLVEETIGETNNAKSASVKEENLAKRTEAGKAIEAEVSISTSVEKNLNAEKEQSVASPTKDLKTV